MNFMNGRYGKFDMLDSMGILVAALFCIFSYTRVISYGIVLYILYRFFSKDIYKRQQEEIKFQGWLRKISSKLYQKSYTPGYSKPKKPLTQRMGDWVNEKKEYKILKCPSCGQKLRVPRGKGKIVVTCKKCSNEFKAKS